MESNVTVVHFEARSTQRVSYENGQRKVQTIMQKHTMCYVNKTNEQIHEQLHGWDNEYKLFYVIKVKEPIDVEYKSHQMFGPKYPITILFYKVMDKPHTEVFYDLSDYEIQSTIDSRNYQSYTITNVIHSHDYKIDALNSITRFKDTN